MLLKSLSLAMIMIAITLSPATSEEPVGYSSLFMQCAIDNQGNLHTVWMNYDWGDLYYMKYKYDEEIWVGPTYLPGSTPAWFPYTLPSIQVASDGRAHILYGQKTGDYPHDLNHIFYVVADDADGTTFTIEASIGDDGYRRGSPELVLDANNNPHMSYNRTNKYPPFWWELMYRSPNGTEKVIAHFDEEAYAGHDPTLAIHGSQLHMAWYQGSGGKNDIWYATGTENIAGSAWQRWQVSNVPPQHYANPPNIGVSPSGDVRIAYLVTDWSEPWNLHHTGFYLNDPYGGEEVIDGPADMVNEFIGDQTPELAWADDGTRYLGWSFHSRGETYYQINDDRYTLEPAGWIDVCAGNGAWYMRTTAIGTTSGVMYFQMLAPPGGANTPPTVTVLTPPASNAEANTSYTVTWDDWDPDDNASISLHYDTDNFGFNGTAIPGAGAIEEDPDGSGDQFNWDIAGLPDNATYWVYATINDGANPPVSDYSAGYLFVNHDNDPPWIQLTSPVNADTAEGGWYTISWNDTDPDDNAMISLFYSPVDSPSDSTLIVQGLNEDSQIDEYPWDLSGVDPGVYRIYAVISDGTASSGDHSEGTVLALLTVTYTPTDDASVFIWEPDEPHGDSPDLEFGADDFGVPDAMTFFKFNVTELEYAVVKAYLYVYCLDQGGGGGVHSVVSTAWTEEDLTWNNMPGIGLAPVFEIDTIYPSNWYKYNVTSLVSGIGPVAMVLRSEAPNGAHLASKEYTNPAYRPYLELLVGGDPPMLPPTAQILSITPDPVIQGYHSEVSFIGTAWDNDEGGDSIDLWRWYSDLDGIIGSTQNLDLDPMTLSVGTHEISFRVRDNEGDWSPYDTDDLEVKPVDTSGPTWPNGTGVQSVENTGTGGKVEISWNSAADANPPVTYNIYYNTASPAFAGTKLENVSWEVGEDYDCNYILSGLTNGQPYYVGVRAVDLVGNEDGNEVELVATPADITPPSFTSGPNAVDLTSTSARIVWTTNEPATSIVGYWITPEESLSVEDPTFVTAHSVQLAGLNPGTIYFYRAYSSDAWGNDAMSGVQNFQTATGSIYSYLPTDDAYVVSWEPNQNFGSSTRLIVETNEISYLRFEVMERDDVMSARLQIYCADTGDTAAVWHVTDTEWNEETLVWNNRPQIDGPYVGGIRTPTEGQVYSVDVSSVITGSGIWAFAMRGPARDICQFYSKEHTAEAERPYLVVEFAGDTEPPAQVTGLTCTAVGGSDLLLEWNASTDNVGVAGYRVYRSTEPFFEPLPRHVVATQQATQYTDTEILGNTEVEHYYVVTAYDSANNESEASLRVGENEFALGE
jgi:hypothetical protein